ncbi:MAG: hypothetical protein H8E26_09310 [FCB group bacterium]|nr:hypothetical protein [FCB group bacterium]MBC8376233.1 hypothetical protein [FCB group bacterium]MBL7029106.1 hypothetical protein [Candidatus Neomarinimicrobiota bacterium]MBL7122017.1 hypothetical protein [Candidatus Neomarinimicrobiota bacterium]
MRKLILLLILAISLMGQSAYYRLGYGDIFPTTDVLGSSLGHGVVALDDSNRVTTHNPAALTSSSRVHFGVSLGSEFRSIDNIVSNTTRLEHLFVSLPLGKRIGMSLGTNAVADFASDYEASLDMGAFSEQSSGGIWDFHIGMGYSLSPVIKLGLKLHTFQGQLRRETMILSDDIQELYVIKGDISGKSIEAGVISNVREKVSLGLTVNIPYDKPTLSGHDSLAGSSVFTEIEEEMDAWPSTIKLGVIYHHSKTMNFTAGIAQQLFTESGFDEARVFALPAGWKTVPVASFQLAMQKLPTDRTSRYWTKRTGWQTGVSIKNYYLSPASENMIYEYSLISGVNLDLRNGRSLFEISGEFGSRGGDESLPDELFTRMKLGIQINDMWFKKVKRR